MKKIIYKIAIVCFLFLLTGCNLFSPTEEENEIFLIFNSNYGSYVDDIEFNGNETITLPSDPTKLGYLFDGWYLDDNTFLVELTSDYFVSNPVTETTYAYAKWIIDEANPPRYFTITFDSNGGSAVTPITQQETLNIAAPTNPTRTGYEFCGWCSDQELTISYIFNRMPSEDITLYAAWSSVGLTYTNHVAYYSVKQNTETIGNQTNIAVSSIYNGLPVTKIDNQAFKDNTYIIDVTLPSSITFIGYAAFEGCTNLESINLPENLTSIETAIFKDCRNLLGVDIPNDVTIIRYDAFMGCYDLTSITIPEKTTEVQGTAFMLCSKLMVVNVLRDVNLGYTNFGQDVFDSTSAGMKIYVPSNSVDTYKDRYNLLPNIDQIFALPEIFFETNEGSTIENQIVPFGATAVVPSEPIKTGFEFGGWFLESDFQTQYFFDQAVEVNTTLYAYWNVVE